MAGLWKKLFSSKDETSAKALAARLYCGVIDRTAGMVRDGSRFLETRQPAGAEHLEALLLDLSMSAITRSTRAPSCTASLRLVGRAGAGCRLAADALFALACAAVFFVAIFFAVAALRTRSSASRRRAWQTVLGTMQPW
jgi:hypothetical protein